VILGAAGPVFSAGHDLRELVPGQRAEAERLFALCTEVMEAIRLLPKPVIAQVQGLATAAGCQLAASCDLVVASEEARFATPGVGKRAFYEQLPLDVPGAYAVAQRVMIDNAVAADAQEGMTAFLAKRKPIWKE